MSSAGSSAAVALVPCTVVRCFSVWDESGRAEAAVSLDEREAERLAHFLGPQRPRQRQPQRTLDALLETLRL